jgi:broad specificity phosphatase PhoE
MSARHKAALAEGREQARSVRRYLEALELNRPKRGRKRTAETVRRQLASVEQELKGADPLSRLHLLQERRDLEAELDRKSDQLDLTRLESGFVKAAKPYSRRKGISYAAWREAGVDVAVLRKAGIDRSFKAQ